MSNIKNKIWNPFAFFISFFMSLLMPFIFAVPMGMPISILFLWWGVRWVVAYFLVVLIINPISLKLAIKVFNFKPGF